MEMLYRQKEKETQGKCCWCVYLISLVLRFKKNIPIFVLLYDRFTLEHLLHPNPAERPTASQVITLLESDQEYTSVAEASEAGK